ncbi:DUF4870 domain-containing protein [Halobacteria archaeon AArc-m2/3/4]|uniref:DUF4870 domain-containing protein n=1 Tax=Natronoglomus mannanivorans TaxID=2979990 RepID=A0AAP2Z0U5_9EURY|nr:DUF4870 domain-containing protein [Halobacteria archaeon AArc-xg1-1]MCU4975335.1 DUF4870 domain-containing protein [Halobacteria archaeon AArc-m2/3/4]
MTSTTPTPNHGPELLDERSVTGIVVHPLAFLTGGLLAIPIYLVSSHEYTRANARNALNWYLSVVLLTVVSFTVFFLGADEMTVGGEPVEWSLLPEPFHTIVGFVGILLLLPTILAWMATLLFAVVATIKAIFGTAWEYPFARRLVGSDTETGTR